MVDTGAGVIAGHGRLLAARKLNLSAVPIIVLDLLTAEDKLTRAVQQIGNGAAAAYYEGLAATIKKQLEALPQS